jgi:hypothetical protein
MLIGGEGGIRTPGGLAPPTVFKTVAIDHSATSPNRVLRYIGLGRSISILIGHGKPLPLKKSSRSHF